MANKALQQKQKTQSQGTDMSQYAPDMLVWVEQIDPQQDEESFFKAKVISVDSINFMIEVLYDSTKKEIVAVNRIMERVDFGNTMKDGFDDMVNMEILNDAELMENVRKRFMRDSIFTYVGPTLLVVNPFKKMPQMANEEVRLTYIKHIIPAKGNPLAYKEVPPNVYAIAAEAYRSLFENDKNQSIVISGESGAGKTENAKFCMSLLISIGSFELFKHEANIITKENMKSTAITGHSSDIVKAALQLSTKEDISIEVKILNCNPILEAFGNSKTKKNNNSSRFGKYVRMKVDKSVRKIKGAEIVNYLLEKSRIIQQGLQERNFHVFYHMLEGSTQEELTHLRLMQNGKRYDYEWFEYLKKSQNFVSPGINDVLLFEEIRQSFSSLGMHENETSIFQVVSAVLLLGNVMFDGSSFGNETPCGVKNMELLNDVAKLVGVEQDLLYKALVLKNRKVVNQVINSPLPEVECIISKDSLAKELYERLFNWLVYKLNNTIKPKTQNDQCYVGLLDIYGFEVFDLNTFEQLMINYTNEKLHQLYIFYVFKEEERVFVSEGLEKWCSQIKFNDNTLLIELIEKAPVGIFNLLDESSSMASQTDDHLLQNIRKQHKTNPLLLNPKQPTTPTFIIIHTAKEVEYNVHGFRAKNKDETSSMLLDLMSNSSDVLVAQMFSKSDQAVKADKFLATKIKKEMAELMNELNSCDVHFIRCIKPNELKQSNVLHQSMTLNQIRYLGVLDSLKVRKDSYPIRRTFKVFFKQYGDISKDEPYPLLLLKKVEFRSYTIKLVKDFFSNIEPENFLVGTTKIFMRQPGLTEVIRIYTENIKIKSNYATKIQRMFRCFKFRQGVKKYMEFLKRLKYILHIKIQANRLRKYTLKVIHCQKFIKTKIMSQRRVKLLNIAKTMQKVIKRRVAVDQMNKMKKAVIKLQRFIKRIIKDKERRKLALIKQSFFLAFNRAWLVIENRQATKIQKTFRGWKTRTKVIGKTHMNQIKEAGIQERMRKNATLISRWVRGWLVRVRVRKMHKAASLIQGYFKMLWLSELFQAMRKNIIIIQKFVRMFVRKRQAYHEKYERFILPWDKLILYIKEQEEINLFGVSHYLKHQEEPEQVVQTQRMDSISLQSYFSTQSPISSRQVVEYQSQKQGHKHSLSIQVNEQTSCRNGYDQSSTRNANEYQSSRNGNDQSSTRNANEHSFSPQKIDHSSIVPSRTISQHKRNEPDFQQSLNQSRIQPIIPILRNKEFDSVWQYQSVIESLDSILHKEQELQVLNQKLQLFSVVIDLEILFDLTEIYTEPWTKTYKEIMQAMFTRQAAIQVFEVGQTHSIAVSVSGKAYTWGLNDVNQLGHGGEPLDKPQAVNLPSDFKIKQISSGSNHTLVLGYDGTMYGFGQNNVGQLGQANSKDYDTPKQIFTGQDAIAEVRAVGNSSFAVTQNGQLYTWPLENDFKPFLVQLNFKSPVVSVSCGNQFAIIRQANGCLLSFGQNLEGELGHGDTKLRTDPCLIEKLANAGDKIVQVECGFKHVIAKSNLGKVFTWGWGQRGQLGHGVLKNEKSPKLLIIGQKVLQVAVSYKSTIVLTESHKLLWCGSNQSITNQTLLKDIKLDHKSGHLNTYTPIRIYPSWSNSLSLITVTFANVRNILSSNVTLKQKVLNQLVQKWVDNGAHTIDPPFIPQLASYVQEKHMKINQIQKLDLKQQARGTMTEKKKAFPDEGKKGYKSSEKTKKLSPSTPQLNNDPNNLSKLKEIKKRLVILKTLPQTQWSEQDVEFIRTIYKSNLSQLLVNLHF